MDVGGNGSGGISIILKYYIKAFLCDGQGTVRQAVRSCLFNLVSTHIILCTLKILSIQYWDRQV